MLVYDLIAELLVEGEGWRVIVIHMQLDLLLSCRARPLRGERHVGEEQRELVSGSNRQRQRQRDRNGHRPRYVLA